MNRIKFHTVVILLFFVSCQEDPTEDSIPYTSVISEYAQIINLELSQALTIDLDQFFHYSNYLEKAENAFNTVVKRQKQTTDLYSLDQILNDTPKPYYFEIPITDFEKEFIRQFISLLTTHELADKIEIFNVSEDFIKMQIQDSFIKEKILYEMASIKLVLILNLQESNPSLLKTKSGKLTEDEILCYRGKAFDRCFDGCMNRTFSKMNPVKWVQFALNPPAYVAWHAGSCVYDCATA